MNANSSTLCFATNATSQGLADLRLIQKMAEGAEIRTGEDLIHLIATAENSVLALSVESFLSKYWQSLWKDGKTPTAAILHELSGTEETLNREMLYRLLLTILCDSKRDSAEPDRSQFEALSVQAARDIAAANECEPSAFSDLPPAMMANLPQPSEFIACSLAMECLCEMLGDSTESPWKTPNPPVLSRQSLEGIAKALGNRHCHPSTPGSIAYFESVIRKILSWQK